MQQVHRSVLFDSQEEDPLKARERIHSQSEVCQEGVKSPDGPFLFRQAPPVLENLPKTAREDLYHCVRELAGPKHLSHQPRRPRGVKEDRGSPTGGCTSARRFTGVHKACA